MTQSPAPSAERESVAGSRWQLRTGVIPGAVEHQGDDGTDRETQQGAALRKHRACYYAVRRSENYQPEPVRRDHGETAAFEIEVRAQSLPRCQHGTRQRPRSSASRLPTQGDARVDGQNQQLILFVRWKTAIAFGDDGEIRLRRTATSPPPTEPIGTKRRRRSVPGIPHRIADPQFVGDQAKGQGN